MLVTIGEGLTQGCCSWVFIFFAGAVLLMKLSKPREGEGRVGSAAKYAAKKAATRTLFNLLFKRKW
jgi:hypothetical protein